MTNFKKLLLLLNLSFLVLLVACSNNIDLSEVQGTWTRIENYTIDEEQEVMNLETVSFLISNNEIIQDGLTSDFELENNQITLGNDDFISFNQGINEIVLNGNILTINDIDYFLEGSPEYEAHLANWEELANESLYNIFSEIWAWRVEVDEVTSDFTEAVLSFDTRMEQELTDMLIGSTWRMYRSVAGGAEGTETFYGVDGVAFIFLEDNRFIFTGNERDEPAFGDFEARLLSTSYEFNLDLEASFSIETEIIEIGWNEFERITHLELTRDMEESLSENKLFLDEIRLEIESLNNTTITDMLEQGAIAVELWNEDDLIRHRLPRDWVEFNNDEFTASNSLGGTSGWFVTYRKEDTDTALVAELLEGFLAEIERQEAVAEVMENLTGTWVRFIESESDRCNPTGIEEIQLVIEMNSFHRQYTAVQNFYYIVSENERSEFCVADGFGMGNQGHNMTSLHLSDDLQYLNQMNLAFPTSASTSSFSIDGNTLHLTTTRRYGLSEIMYQITSEWKELSTLEMK